MRYFIIDGYNLAYRAHNVNFELRTTDGRFSGMFYGFLRSLNSLKKKYRGCKFVVVWDNKPKHKYEINAEYKAGRTPLPDKVKIQIDYLKKAIYYIGVDQYAKKDQEADDVIATLVNYLKHNGADNIIVYTNDKDMLQLVEDGKVTVFRPKGPHVPEKFFDEEAVRESFGVSVKKLACYRSFDGDSSDNIKGVPRVPRKIIASLVNKYGDIDLIYEALPEIKLTDFQRKSFLESKERVRDNLKIISLNRDLDNISRVKSTYDKESFEKLLNEFEIKSIKADDVISLFSSSLNIKYTEPKPTKKVESYSLF